MSWIGTAIGVVGIAINLAGNRKAKKAEKEKGQRTQIAREYEAKQLEQQAGQEIASSQRAASEERRRARIIASRSLALAAASGAGASDTTVSNLLADIEGEGAYRASLALYQGEESARKLRMGADGKRYEGQAAADGADIKASAYDLEAAGTVISGASSIYGKYNDGGPGKSEPKTAPVTSEYDYTGYA